MKLQSVSKPAGEAQPQFEKPAQVTASSTTNASGNAVAKDKTTKKRIVVGKRDKPILPPAGGITLESIIGADERTRIRETEETPWRMVCALEIEGPWGNFVGTGWLAGPRTIITAGHCVFDSTQMGGWAKKIRISPGRDGDERPVAPVESEKFSTVDRWRANQDPDFDMAAIHLTQPLGDTLGWFGVASLTDDQLRGYMVNVSGYPGTPGGGTEQWWAKNRIREVTPRRIFYEVDTSGGQSGGPAYIYESVDSPPVVVGIHAYGTGGTPQNIPFQVNSAPRIIPEVVAQIQTWIDKDNAGG
jgi:glutamyl endopeptidase